MLISDIKSNEDFKKYAVAQFEKRCKDEQRVFSSYEQALFIKGFQSGALAVVGHLDNEASKDES